MNIEITDLVGVAALATSFLAYIEARKGNRNTKSEDVVAALGKVISASEKTQTYLNQPRKIYLLTGRCDSQEI